MKIKKTPDYSKTPNLATQKKTQALIKRRLKALRKKKEEKEFLDDLMETLGMEPL